jgi:hypothetical protein
MRGAGERRFFCGFAYGIVCDSLCDKYSGSLREEYSIQRCGQRTIRRKKDDGLFGSSK